MVSFTRIFFQKGEKKFLNTPLVQMQEEANALRNFLHPSKEVTYVLDANPNYTNVCNIHCTFCAFYRRASDKDAYLLSFDNFRAMMHKYQQLGIKTVLLQGGVHPSIGIDYLLELLKITINEFPSIHPHFFSAVEIYYAAKVSNISTQQALQMLWDAGALTIPGGGAEILSERVRKKISPKKLYPNGWIDFHKLAHQIGFKTTATMMFNHLESYADILNHLESLRRLQDEYQGFYSFIPWSYKPSNTALCSQIKHPFPPDNYYRIIAFSRLYLDNFPHIAASWFGEGKKIGSLALSYGADDFGGTIIDESVHKCAGWDLKSTEEEIQDIIRSAGFIPRERNSFYEKL